MHGCVWADRSRWQLRSTRCRLRVDTSRASSSCRMLLTGQAARAEPAVGIAGEFPRADQEGEIELRGSTASGQV